MQIWITLGNPSGKPRSCTAFGRRRMDASQGAFHLIGSFGIQSSYPDLSSFRPLGVKDAEGASALRRRSIFGRSRSSIGLRTCVGTLAARILLFGALYDGTTLRGNAWYGSKDAFGCPCRSIAFAYGRKSSDWRSRNRRFGAETGGVIRPRLDISQTPNPFVLEPLRRPRLPGRPKDEGNSFGCFLWMVEFAGRRDLGQSVHGSRDFGPRILLQATAEEQTTALGQRRKQPRPADEKTDVFGQRQTNPPDG